jgi:hypothetical protein
MGNDRCWSVFNNTFDTLVGGIAEEKDREGVDAGEAAWGVGTIIGISERESAVRIAI